MAQPVIKVSELVNGLWGIFSGNRRVGFWYQETGHVYANNQFVGVAKTPEEVERRLYKGNLVVWKMKVAK